MELEELQAIVGAFMGGLPDKISDTLEDVEVVLCESPTDGTDELLASFDEPPTDEQKALVQLPADCKGVFIGDPMERSDDGSEDPEEETIYDPDGVIVLCANNIASRDDAVLIILHEVGHALGLDEAEVKALGLAVAQAKESKPDATAPQSNG